jgi:hypothetical protein
MRQLNLLVDVQIMRNLQFNEIRFRQGKQGYSLTPNFRRHNPWRVTVVTRQCCPTTSQCYRTDYSAFLCSRIRGRPSCNPCAKCCQHDSRWTVPYGYRFTSSSLRKDHVEYWVLVQTISTLDSIFHKQTFVTHSIMLTDGDGDIILYMAVLVSEL